MVLLGIFKEQRSYEFKVEYISIPELNSTISLNQNSFQMLTLKSINLLSASKG